MGMTVTVELAVKRRRRAQQSRRRMAARGINLAKWDTDKRRQQDAQK